MVNQVMKRGIEESGGKERVQEAGNTTELLQKRLRYIVWKIEGLESPRNNQDSSRRHGYGGTCGKRMHKRVMKKTSATSSLPLLV